MTTEQRQDGDGAGVEAGAPSEAQARWYLEDEREFLQRSLDDASREHAAGDLSDADLRVLVARDRHRLAEVEAELAALGPRRQAKPTTESTGPAPGTRMSGWRRVVIVAACFLIAAGAVILVIHARHPRQPGQSSSGGVTLSQAQEIVQQLNQAQGLSFQGKILQSLKLYDKVLAEDPTNIDAMSNAGWLTWTTGFDSHVPKITADGRAEIERSVKLSPNSYGGHLFLGLVLANQDNNYSAAVTQFNDFVFDNPPASLLVSAAPLVAPSYQQAGVALPSAFASVLATTTTTTSAP
jgi:tetratricopeptide (TPR) repeat protein